MAINDRALALLADRRADLDMTLDLQTLTLVKAWVEAWDTLAPEFDAALAELIAAAKDDRVSGSQVAKNIRLRKALTIASEKIKVLAATAESTIVADVAATALAAAQSQIDIAQAQLPPADRVATLPTFTQVSDDALSAIVTRSTQQITSALQPLPDDVTAAMKRELVRGIAVGDNPRTTARRIIKSAEGRFNGGLTRALVVSRTEMLDAHRAATKAADKANTDVMAGWVWGATLDRRTCPSCLAQHGQFHEIDEDGPQDHQQGRCTRIPKTKSWKDLGFEEIDEPEDLVKPGDAEKWFDNLTADTQKQIMGAERLELLQSGQIQWADLSTKVSTDGWRDSMHVTPVSRLRELSPA